MFEQILKSSIEEIEFFLECGCDPNISIDLYSENGTILKTIGTIDTILKYYYYRPCEEWKKILSLLILYGVSLDFTFYKDFQEKIPFQIQKQIFQLQTKKPLLLLFF